MLLPSHRIKPISWIHFLLLFSCALKHVLPRLSVYPRLAPWKTTLHFSLTKTLVVLCCSGAHMGEDYLSIHIILITDVHQKSDFYHFIVLPCLWLQDVHLCWAAHCNIYLLCLLGPFHNSVPVLIEYA